MAFDNHRMDSTVASRRRMREGIAVRSPGEPAERVQHILYDSVSDPTDTESEQEMLSKAEARRQHCYLPSAGSAGHGTAAGCRPCAFYIPSVGCRNGTACNFCHYDHSPEERQLPKPSSRPAKGKRDKDKRRIAEINQKYSNDESKRQEELRKFAQSQSYAAKLLGFESGRKGAKGGYKGAQVEASSRTVAANSAQMADGWGNYAEPGRVPAVPTGPWIHRAGNQPPYREQEGAGVLHIPRR